MTPDRERSKAVVLPEKGRSWKELERELWDIRAHDRAFEHVMMTLSFPSAGTTGQLVAKEAASMYFNVMDLGRDTQPGAARLHSEIEAIALGLLRGSESARSTMTSCGTESNFIGVKVAREWAREHLPEATEPEIVIPETAHPSFDLAAHYLGVGVVRVPCRDDFRADLDAIKAALTKNTILVAGSVPQWPHGVVDPIPELAALTDEHGAWFHVDACVGGFLVPFLRRIGKQLPEFELDVPGVNSIAADVHKYGFAPLGVSTFNLRDGDDFRFQVFEFDNWPTGSYSRSVPGGTRNSDVVAGAWAVMQFLGQNGYERLARQVDELGDRLQRGIEAIDGLRLVAPPEAGILCYASETLDMGAVATGLALRGYHVHRVKQPDSIHLCLDVIEEDQYIDEYVEVLGEVVRDVVAGKVTNQEKEVVYA